MVASTTHTRPPVTLLPTRSDIREHTFRIRLSWDTDEYRRRSQLALQLQRRLLLAQQG